LHPNLVPSHLSDQTEQQLSRRRHHFLNFEETNLLKKPPKTDIYMEHIYMRLPLEHRRSNALNITPAAINQDVRLFSLFAVHGPDMMLD